MEGGVDMEHGRILNDVNIMAFTGTDAMKG